MSNEELVQQIQEGHKELLPKLWDGVRGFVARQAYKAARLEERINGNAAINVTQDEEETLGLFYDFFNTGYLAMDEAVYKFDPKQGVLFLTYLGYYLKAHFNTLRAQLSGWSTGTYYKARKEIKLDSLNRLIIGDGSGDTTELGDLIADPNDLYEELLNEKFIESLRERLALLLERLPPEQSKAIQLRYYSNLSYKDIAVSTDLPPEKVRQIVADGMERLRSFAVAGELDDYIERHTNYYTRVSVDRFRNNGMSAVELICMRREEKRRGILEKIKK